MAGENKLATVQQNGVKSEEYWALRLLKMIKMEADQYVFQKLGVPKNLPLNQGTTKISMHRANSLPISSTGALEVLTEGVAPASLKVEYQKVQAVVQQYGNWIKYTDFVDAIAFDDIKKDYMPELSRVATEQRERVVLDSFSEASERFVNGRTSNATITASDVLTLKECRMAWLTMKNYNRKGNSRYGGKPVVVVHTNVMQDLLDDSTLLDNILVPGNENTPMKNGTLESYKAYGIYFQETLMCEVEKGAGAGGINVYNSVMLGEDPYATINFNKLEWKQTGFEAEKTDALGQYATFGYKQWFGSKVIDPMAIIVIKSASAYDILPNFATDPIGRTASQA